VHSRLISQTVIHSQRSLSILIITSSLDLAMDSILWFSEQSTCQPFNVPFPPHYSLSKISFLEGERSLAVCITVTGDSMQSMYHTSGIIWWHCMCSLRTSKGLAWNVAIAEKIIPLIDHCGQKHTCNLNICEVPVEHSSHFCWLHCFIWWLKTCQQIWYLILTDIITWTPTN